MKNIFLIVFFFLSVNFILGQVAAGSFVIALPQGEFAEKNDNTGFGFQIQGSLPTPGKVNPISFGLSIGYYIFQSSTERRPFSLTIPDVTVEVDRSHNMANFHFLIKGSPLTGTVRPYLELVGGGSYLFTETKIYSNYEDKEIASDTNFDDWAWSYGGGGGVLILVARNLGDVSNLFVDLKVRYLKGTEARYLTKDDIEIEGLTGKVYYYPRTSQTDLLTIHLGVSAFF